MKFGLPNVAFCKSHCRGIVAMSCCEASRIKTGRLRLMRVADERAEPQAVGEPLDYTQPN